MFCNDISQNYKIFQVRKFWKAVVIYGMLKSALKENKCCIHEVQPNVYKYIGYLLLLYYKRVIIVTMILATVCTINMIMTVIDDSRYYKRSL